MIISKQGGQRGLIDFKRIKTSGFCCWFCAWLCPAPPKVPVGSLHGPSLLGNEQLDTARPNTAVLRTFYGNAMTSPELQLRTL